MKINKKKSVKLEDEKNLEELKGSVENLVESLPGFAPKVFNSFFNGLSGLNRNIVVLS